MATLYDESKRRELFMTMLPLHNYDVSYDWFHEYFQDEHADRKEKKQDFTPNSVGTLLSKLVGSGEQSNLDIAAGTGGLTIQKWHNDMMSDSVFTYKPSEHIYVCEELSDRTIPFLLFNMLLRGMNGIVLHGDTLTRKFKGAFFIQNETDNYLGFSTLNVVPDSQSLREMFRITDLNNIYPAHIESVEWPVHLK